MKYRKFGKTGMEVSEVGFGCGRTGGLLIDGSDDDRRAAVRQALDGGINWFDTAEAYGDGKSEEALGWLLEEVSETPHVSTKVTVDPGAGDLAGQIKSHCEASLKRLRRDWVDILQIHNRIDPGAGPKALSVEQVLGPGGIAEGLENMKQEGKARFMGLTALGDPPSLRGVIETGRFDSVQMFYNMVNPSAVRAMPGAWTGQNLNGIAEACRAAGTGILAIRVLVGGIIPGGDPGRRVSMMTKETDKETEERKAEAALGAIGDGYGTRAQTGLRFALACPDISVALVGIGAVGHVDEAIAASAMGALPEEAIGRLEALYESDFNPA